MEGEEGDNDNDDHAPAEGEEGEVVGDELVEGVLNDERVTSKASTNYAYSLGPQDSLAPGDGGSVVPGEGG